MKSINRAVKFLRENFKNLDRMECMVESEAYIAIKDLKGIFSEKPTFRLINPSKSDTENVEKGILDQINQSISQNTNVNKLKNSTTVIDWLKAIDNKPQSTFFVFDIERFYTSISLDLFEKALTFAKQITAITDNSLRNFDAFKKKVFVPWWQTIYKKRRQ